MKTHFVGILLNVTGICLWGLTLFFMFRNKGKDHSDPCKREIRGAIRTFDEEIFAQRLKQRSEISFNRITDMIQEEKKLLLQLLEREGMVGKTASMARKVSAVNPVSHPEYRRKMPETGEKYSIAIKLARKGVPAHKISEMVGLPKGEIDLLVKLRGQGRHLQKK